MLFSKSWELWHLWTLLKQVASFILLGNMSKHHLSSPWMILSFPNQWKTLSESTFSNNCTKISGSLQHQAFYRSNQTLFLAIKTKMRIDLVWFSVYFFFRYFCCIHNCSICLSAVLSVYNIQTPRKSMYLFRSLLGDPIAVDADLYKLMLVTKVMWK